MYSRFQKFCNNTTIDLPHINLIIFPASACPSYWFNTIVVFHCSACLLQDFAICCTESDGKLNRGLPTRLYFCVSYDVRKSHQHSCSCVHVCVCVGVHCVCMYMRVCVSMFGRERSSTSLIALYVNLNNLLHLSESPKVPLVTFL